MGKDQLRLDVVGRAGGQREEKDRIACRVRRDIKRFDQRL